MTRRCPPCKSGSSRPTSIRTTAGLMHVSQQTARRVLITFGAYSSPEVTAVAELKDMGLSLEQIADKLHVTRKTVISNSPYTRGSYATGHRESDCVSAYTSIRADENEKRQEESTMTKYIVIDEQERGLGDVYTDVYDTLAEANEAAADQWAHLTTAEKKKRHVAVGIVTESDLSDWAFDDDGIDWACFNQCATSPEAFDSDKEEGK